MVRAIIDVRKTQTHLTIKLPHQNHLGVWSSTRIGAADGGRTSESVPLQSAIAPSGTHGPVAA